MTDLYYIGIIASTWTCKVVGEFIIWYPHICHDFVDLSRHWLPAYKTQLSIYGPSLTLTHVIASTSDQIKETYVVDITFTINEN